MSPGLVREIDSEPPTIFGRWHSQKSLENSPFSNRHRVAQPMSDRPSERRQACRETAAPPEAGSVFALLGLNKLSAAIGRIRKSQIRPKKGPGAPQRRARNRGIDGKSGEHR
jgi:hypothetical protein